MRSLRTTTGLFLLMVLVPGVILAWLGWQATDTFAVQVRRHALADSRRAAASIRTTLPEHEAAVLARVRADLRGVANRIRRGFVSGGSLVAGLVDNGSLRYALVHRGGESLVPPGPRPDPEHLQEWAEFGARRSEADEVEFVVGYPRAAGQRMLDLGHDLATHELEARAFARAVMSFSRGGDSRGVAAATAELLRLPLRESLAASPIVMEALLVTGPGRHAVEAQLENGALLWPPTTREQRQRWAGRLAMDERVEATKDELSVEVPYHGSIQLRCYVGISDLLQRIVNRAAEHLEGFELREAADSSTVEVAIDGSFGAAVVHLANPTLDAIDEGMRTNRVLTGLGILALLMVMSTGLFLARQAITREQAARRLRDEFIANVSHELRTPLTSIRLHAGMMSDPALDSPTRDAYGQVLEAEGARMSALVEDLLDFAALERGQRHLSPAPVNLAAAAAATTAAWQSIAAREGVVVRLESPEVVVAMADSTALSRILANLVQNALKHGRPAPADATPYIDLRVGTREDAMTIEVRDNGPGIVAKERPQVFESFRQGAAAVGRGGAGIGLSLSRELARAMGGDLVLVDDPEATVFCLTLPGVTEIGSDTVSMELP